MRVVNDITEVLDQGNMTVLIMLDLSAAFDVIDHDILLKRLEYSYGISDNTLSWFESYLKDRTQCVSVGNATSSDLVLNFSVPQGSVLGPRAYCMFAKPIGEIIRRHNLKYHCYADDSQVYMTFKKTDDWDRVSSSVEACVDEISAWMRANMLKLNQAKTEMIVFRPKKHASNTCNKTITVGGNTIVNVFSVKNLGVHLDCSQCNLK